MTENTKLSKRYIFVLKLITASLLTAQFLLLLMALYINQESIKFYPSDFNGVLGMLLIFGSFAVVITYMVLSKKHTKLIKSEEDVNKKMPLYQNLHIMKYALLSGISILAILFFLFSENIFFLAYMLVSVFFQINYFPTKIKVMSNMEISDFKLLEE